MTSKPADEIRIGSGDSKDRLSMQDARTLQNSNQKERKNRVPKLSKDCLSLM
jgi:hypothetical protein